MYMYEGGVREMGGAVTPLELLYPHNYCDVVIVSSEGEWLSTQITKRMIWFWPSVHKFC